MKDLSPIAGDLKSLVSVAKARRTKRFAYFFVFAFVATTAFLAFNPSNNASSPWFYNLFSSSSASSLNASIAPYRSQVSSLFSHLFTNSTGDNLGGGGNGSYKDPLLGALKKNATRVGVSSPGVLGKNGELDVRNKTGSGVIEEKHANNGVGFKEDGSLDAKNQTGSGVSEAEQVKNGSGSDKNGLSAKKDGNLQLKNQTVEAKQVNNGVVAKKDGNLSASNQTGSRVSEVKQAMNGAASDKNAVAAKTDGKLEAKNQTGSGISESKLANKGVAPEKDGSLGAKSGDGSDQIGVVSKNEGNLQPRNQTGSRVDSQGSGVSSKNQTATNGVSENTQQGLNSTFKHATISNSTSSQSKSESSSKTNSSGSGRKRVKWIEDMIGCDLFHGQWVKDDSYPLYPEGSCPYIDESFDCYLNGRPDHSYQKLRWQPSGCNIPRLDGADMLERLRDKRLVFVGDSLNRNMWESLLCTLRNSVKDKKKVFEAFGRKEFRSEGSYSFMFKDYNATVEFYRSPFLVQEWEMPSGNTTKETLRLDVIQRSSSKYKDAHVIIFNTGHWWTHEKTSKGKDYYQEGNRVYSELKVKEAFHKALNTWAEWVDTNVNPKKTMVLFRGYSASHFSGGQWNAGGACDQETEPIKNEKYISFHLPIMSVVESVINKMKTPVKYLNITRMTDYRKDAHPSVYRKQNLTEEERKDPLSFQDCSHWCLPGVPDSWNELVYAQLIINQYQMGI